MNTSNPQKWSTKMNTSASRRRASRYAKWEGDDIYSYALFVNGRAVYTGMSKSEAKWRRDRYVETGEL